MTSEQGDSHAIWEDPNAIHQVQQPDRSSAIDTPEEQELVLPQSETGVDEESPRGTRSSSMGKLGQFIRRFSPVLVPLPFAILIFLFTLPFALRGLAYLPLLPLAVLLLAVAVLQGTLLYYAGSNDTYWTLFVIIGYALFLVVGTLAIFGLGASLFLVTTFLIIFTFLARRSIRQVPEGYVDIVLITGKYARTLYPGPNLKMPWEKVSSRVTTKEISWTCPQQVVKISRDQEVKLVATISYQLLPEDAHTAALNVDNWEASLQKLFISTLQNVINGLNSADFAGQSDNLYAQTPVQLNSKDAATITRWVSINDILKKRNQDKVASWGVQVNDVRIQDITLIQTYPFSANDKRIQVFLCYSFGNKKDVQELSRRLQTRSINPWLDAENLSPGQDWQKGIMKAVHTSDVVLVCLSQSSFNKDDSLQEDIEFVLNMVAVQLEEALSVLVVRLEQCNIPVLLRRWQCIDLFEEQGYQQLLHELDLRAVQVFSDYYWNAFQEALGQTLISEGIADPSAFPDIPIIHAERLLKRYMNEHPDSDLEYQDNPPCLKLLTADNVRRIHNLLNPLILGVRNRFLKDNLNEFEEQVEKLLREFSSSIGLGDVKKQNLKDFAVFLIDTRITFENIRVPNPLPLFANADYEIPQGTIEQLRRLLVSHQLGSNTRVVVMILLCDKHQLHLEKRRIADIFNAYAYDIAIINHEDLLEVVSAKEPERIFRRLILSQISLETVSPYIVMGPTPINFFFGREHELREITERAATSSYILIGGRRIGKTSILNRLNKVLPEVGFRALYHDCSLSTTHSELVQALITNKSWFPNTFPSVSTSFGDVIRALEAEKHLVILLDEADKLIAPDRNAGYPIFNALRAMVNANHCQFVLSGEQALRSELTNPNSPLYNFANEILIGRLDFEAVQELIIRPMKQLEIELSNGAEIVQRIWEFTSGHPNVVQRLCQRLVKGLNQDQARHLTLEDIEAVVKDSDFLRKDFLNVYWERATPLECLCSLVMAKNYHIRKLTEVYTMLSSTNLNVTLNQVDECLERLVDLRNILQRTPEGYEFAVTAFPEVIAKTSRFDDLYNLNLELYRVLGDVELNTKYGFK